MSFKIEGLSRPPNIVDLLPSDPQQLHLMLKKGLASQENFNQELIFSDITTPDQALELAVKYAKLNLAVSSVDAKLDIVNGENEFLVDSIFILNQNVEALNDADLGDNTKLKDVIDVARRLSRVGVNVFSEIDDEAGIQKYAQLKEKFTQMHDLIPDKKS